MNLVKLQDTKSAYETTCVLHNNKHLKKKLRKQFYLQQHPKEKKSLGANLPKEVKDLYTKNYKKLMKEINENKNK